MRITFVALLGVTALLPLSAADPQVIVPPPPPAEVARLIAQLSNSDFDTREAAARRLGEIGRPALAPLEAATASDSPEVVERAGRLITRITRRLENEKALEPASVELPADIRTLGDAFAAIEKQTRYRLRVESDQGVLSRAVKPTPGPKGFWAAMQPLCDAAGLEVASVTPSLQSLDQQERQLREAAARLDDAVKKMRLAVLRENRAACDGQLTQLRAAREAESDAAKKAELAKQLAECEHRMAGIEADLVAFEPQQPDFGNLSHGTVTLRAKTGSGSRPWCEHSVRVEAEPPSADALKRQAADALVVQLRVTPEPKLRWNGVTEAVVLQAVAADDREVVMRYAMPEFDPFVDQNQLRAIKLRQARMIEDSRRSVAPPAVNPVSVVTLVAPHGEPVRRLKSVKGFLRGTVWTEPVEVIAVKEPAVGKTVAATLANGTSLQVKVYDKPSNLSDTSVLIEVTLVYNPAGVKPDADGRTPEEVWLEQQGGRVQPRLQPADPNRASAPDRPFGLVFTGPDGKPLELTRTTTTVQQRYSQQTQLLMHCTLRGYVRLNRTGADAKIGAVTLRGSRLAEVTVPFKLAEVPVTVGTGDGRPLPEDYPVWKK